MVRDQQKYEYILPAGTVLISKKASDGRERRYTIEQVVNGHPLRKNQKIKPEDEIRPVLGQGGFGITYLASRKLKDGNIDLGTAYYAIKEFFLKGSCYREEGSTFMQYSPASADNVKECIKDFKEEANRLKEICKGNPNIVNVNEVFEANGTVYYVMEFLEGESLRSLIKRTGPLSESVALTFIRPIAEAVKYIHTNYRLLHLDIKPDNIMLRQSANGEQTVPVLIDFGVSVHFDKKGQLTTTHTSTGISEGYSPQEQYGGIGKIVEDRKRAHDDGFTSVPLIPCEVDVYALGATLYYILVGTNPYGAFSMNERIVQEKLPKSISERTRKVVVDAMQPIASNRTQTVADFLKGFSERYTLPKGFVLQSQNARYLITEVQDETDSYIRYSATLYTGITNNNEGNLTKSLRYVVLERFNKKIYKRNKDDSVSLNKSVSVELDEEEQKFIDVSERFVGLRENVDSEIDNGIVIRERFIENGTMYAVFKQGWKPVHPLVRIIQDLCKNLQSNGHRIGKIAMLLCVVGVVIYGGYYGIISYQESQKQKFIKRQNMSKRLSTAIENNDSSVLVEFAMMDSARALYPLAKIYFQANDMINTRKFAEMAINHGDDKGKELIKEMETLREPVVSKKAASNEITTQDDDVITPTKIQEEQEKRKDEKKETNKQNKQESEVQSKVNKLKDEQAEAARKALQYVNGERSYENHQKAYEWAQKADPETRAKVIKRLKDMDFPI